MGARRQHLSHLLQLGRRLASQSALLEANSGSRASTLAQSSFEEAADPPYLLVVDGDSSLLYRLPGSGNVVIGRGEEADLRMRDSSISRLHAMLQCDGDETVLLDLDSRNGTRINGERLAAPRTLAGGDVVAMGNATLVVHRPTRVSAVQGMLSSSSFHQRLGEEVERSRRYGRSFSLIHLELGKTYATLPLPIASELAGLLRLPDLLAEGGPGQLLALLPETSAEQAAEPAGRLLQALEPIAPRARAGIAGCPEDGCDPGTLLGSARAAASVAGAGGIAGPGDVASGLRVGDDIFIVADAAMSHVLLLLERVAATEQPILLCGETGVGKEILARLAHRWSPRRERPLTSVHCAENAASRPRELLTALAAAEAAGGGTAGGTIFLREVGCLPAPAQAWLAEVLARTPLRTRVLASTAGELFRAAEEGRFRADLAERIGAATIVIPPLRHRLRDLPSLTRSFLSRACQRRRRAVPAPSPEVLRLLAAYPWPGNVRELRDVVELLAEGPWEREIPADILPAEIREHRPLDLRPADLGQTLSLFGPSRPTLLAGIDADPGN
jgi:pSer/pThr/pTyr-binding forkhead associated (FHA) protein